MSCAAGRKLGELRLFEVGIQLRTSFGGRRRCKRLGSEEPGGSQGRPGPGDVGEGGWLRCEVGWESMLNGCQPRQGEDTSGESGKSF